MGKREVLLAVSFLLLSSISFASFSHDIPKQVRVKMMNLNFPLKIEGTNITIRGLKKPNDIQNAAIPKNSITEIEFHKVAGQKVWTIKKAEEINRVSQNFLEIQSSDSEILISGYRVPTPVLVSSRGDIISAVKFEDYLEGVLAGEMPIGWPLEALKAQAVAARSYTLYQLKVREKYPAQLDGSVLDQVYVRNENPIQRNKIKMALKETQNLILEEGGHILKAYYHSDCGGQTEDPALVWSGEKAAGAQSVVDAQCALSSHSKWNYEVSLDELKSKLAVAGKGIDKLKDIKVLTRTPTGRAALVALGNDQKQTLISGNDLRQALGFNKLKSTLFTLTQADGSVKFIGKGFGHGSGLCQWGAKYMATKGSLANEILHHYYPGAKISSISSAHAQD